MRYLTASLIARSRSENEDIAEAAAAEWEAACDNSSKHLESIRPKLSKGIRTLLSRCCLHDAKVLTITLEERLYFSLFLQVDPTPKEMIELKYRLAKRPRFIHHPSLENDGKPLQWWLYDEFDVIEQDDISLFTHSIVLTGGWELQLLFYDLKLRRFARALFPETSSASEEAVRQLEALPT